MDPRASRVYLDHNASSPLLPEARAAWEACGFGNPSSVHGEGRRARDRVEAAREVVARALGAEPRQVAFTSGATEANNLALKGLFLADAGGRRGLLTGATEHPSVLGPARWLSARGLARWDAVPVDRRGHVDTEALDRLLSGGTTRLLSVSAANGETGVLAPIPDLARAAARAGAILHVDAAQALGRVPVDAGAWGETLVTLSSHKIGGPRGAGALVNRSPLRLEPLVHGGHQERDLRAGTEDTAAIAGFAAAVERAMRDLASEARRLATLRDTLRDGIRERVPGAVPIGDPERCLPQTLSVAFAGADGESLLFALDLAGIAASLGTACTSGSLEPSPVLLAMGVPADLARSTLRFSLGWTSTAADVETVLRVLPDLVRRAREEGPP